jgi:hypothetical protein
MFPGFFGGSVSRLVRSSRSDRVHIHPELDGLDADKLMAVWLAVVFWFCIKSGMLNKWDRGELPE